MPRQIVTAAGHDRSRSLGWLAVAWLEALVVHGPGDVQGMRVAHGDEYTGFVVDCYALDASTGRRLYDSAFISRPKGCDKSGLGARLALFEAFGPCRVLRTDPGNPDSAPVFAAGGEVYRDPFGLGFEYVYEAGEPMGRPVKAPFVRCMATEEGQVGNVYDTIYFNLTEGPLAGAMARKDDAGLTRILLPGGGEIRPSTASSAAKDGGKETFVDFDETHLYTTPELRRMYATVTRNLRKRKKIAETWYIETTTMYQAGADSVAEKTYKLAENIAEGQEKGRRAKRERLLLDHRWGEIRLEDLGNEKVLAAALKEAYGDALGWNHLPGLIDQILDPRADVTDSIRYFLNDKHSPEDAWIQDFEWAGREPGEGQPFKPIAKGDVITLGFDGSRRRSRGVTDATALIGCRVSDGHVFDLGIWEQPPGAPGKTWSAPVGEILAAVAAAFDRHTVVGFYADPAKWESHVASWEAKYGPRLKVKSTQQHPIEWWMTGGRSAYTVRALEQFQSAVVDGEMTHDGSPVLTRHVLAARAVYTRSGIQIAKEHPNSAKKIDGAVAAVLAWAARVDAIASGLGQIKKAAAPSRIR